MILLSVRGYSAPAIVEIQDIAKVTVYKWIDRFDQHGPEGLYDQDREGRPRKFGPDVEAELERMLDGPPTEEGYDASRRTAPRLARHLERKFGTEVHPDTVRRALQHLEYSWKRPCCLRTRRSFGASRRSTGLDARWKTASGTGS